MGALLSPYTSGVLYSYTSSALGTIAGGAVIGNASYRIPAGYLQVNTSLQVTFATNTSGSITCYMDTTPGTEGTLVIAIGASSTPQIGLTLTCIATGISGVVLTSGFYPPGVIGPSSVTVNTTVPNWLEMFNAGTSLSFNDVSYQVVAP